MPEKIAVTINGQAVELDHAEAQRLYEQLLSHFGPVIKLNELLPKPRVTFVPVDVSFGGAAPRIIPTPEHAPNFPPRVWS